MQGIPLYSVFMFKQACYAYSSTVGALGGCFDTTTACIGRIVDRTYMTLLTVTIDFYDYRLYACRSIGLRERCQARTIGSMWAHASTCRLLPDLATGARQSTVDLKRGAWSLGSCPVLIEIWLTPMPHFLGSSSSYLQPS